MAAPGFFSLFENQIKNLANSGDPISPGLIRIEAPIPPETDVLQTILSRPVDEQFYFSDKDQASELGGLGQVLVLSANGFDEAWEQLAGLWNKHENAAVFGGMNFFPQAPDAEEWNGFDELRFTLPLVEIQKTGDKASAAVNFHFPEQTDGHSAGEMILDKLKSLDDLCMSSKNKRAQILLREKEIPDKSRWRLMVEAAIEKIRSGRLEKAVLSRKKVIASDRDWPVADILDNLAGVSDASFVFLYKISHNLAFLGRTPERLVRIRNRIMTVDAIAGTRPRGCTPEQDQALENELINCEKEIEEHRIVSRFMTEKMQGICSGANTELLEQPLKLENVQHILTRYSGAMLNGKTPLETAKALHPTPAVGGRPRKPAMDFIQSCEPHERGWFAGPVGWMNGCDGDFAVAIRSALVKGRELHVFAGAGILEQSNPDSEWTETEIKMQTMLKAAGVC